MSHGSSWKLRHGKVVVVSLVSLVLGRRERLGEVCGDGERLQQDSQIKSSMTSWADQDGSISYVRWIRWKPGTRSGGIGSTAWTNGYIVWGSFQSFNVILRIFCHADFWNSAILTFLQASNPEVNLGELPAWNLVKVLFATMRDEMFDVSTVNVLLIYVKLVSDLYWTQTPRPSPTQASPTPASDVTDVPWRKPEEACFVFLEADSSPYLAEIQLFTCNQEDMSINIRWAQAGDETEQLQDQKDEPIIETFEFSYATWLLETVCLMLEEVWHHQDCSRCLAE